MYIGIEFVTHLFYTEFFGTGRKGMGRKGRGREWERENLHEDIFPWKIISNKY